MLKGEIFHFSVGTSSDFLQSGKCGFENVAQMITRHLHVVGGRKPEAGLSDIHAAAVGKDSVEYPHFRYELIDFSVLSYSGLLSSNGCSEACRSTRLRGIEIEVLEQAEL